jgi:hypothetical protein
MVSDLNNVRKRLGGPGASEKAARAVLEVCGITEDQLMEPSGEMQL